MKITQRQLKTLIENALKEQEFDMGASIEKDAMEGIERLRPKYGNLMKKMGPKHMEALSNYFKKVVEGLRGSGSSSATPSEEHFLRFFVYLHGGPKP